MAEGKARSGGGQGVAGGTLQTTIYALCDPDTGEVRYVGTTVYSLPTRLRGHLRDHLRLPLSKRAHKDRWIEKLKRNGKQPVITTLEIVPGGEWAERERHWIASFREQGARLLNLTDGGEGAPGHRHTHGPEVLAGYIRWWRSTFDPEGDPFAKMHPCAFCGAPVKRTPAQMKKTRYGRVYCCRPHRMKTEAPVTERTVLEVRRRYATEGVTLGQLSKEYGISAPSLSEMINKKSWAWVKDPGREPEPRDRMGYQRFSEDEVRSIRRRHAEGGVKQKDLCEEYRVAPSAMSQMLNRKTYQHVQ